MPAKRLTQAAARSTRSGRVAPVRGSTARSVSSSWVRVWTNTARGAPFAQVTAARYGYFSRSQATGTARPPAAGIRRRRVVALAVPARG